MFLRSLNGKLLLGISALVIGSSLLISLMFTNLYGSSLVRWATAQAENISHAIALEATDKILINDLVALQKMLDQQILSDKAIAYIFVHRGGEILAHTFTGGFPSALLQVNAAPPGDHGHVQVIASTTGEHFLDIAWPVLGGKGGVLRVGFTDKFYRQHIAKLWMQLGALTFCILFLALAATFFFIKRITRPLTALTEAAAKISQGKFDVTVEVKGHIEVEKLAGAFNSMVSRVKEYTLRLENQTRELEHAYIQTKTQAQALERAYHQTKTLCDIVQQVGTFRTLPEIGLFLIKKSQQILKCKHMVLLILNEIQNAISFLSEKDAKSLKQHEAYQHFKNLLVDIKKVTISNKMVLQPPLIPADFETMERQAIVPLHYQNKPFGALVIACPGECQCSMKEIEVVGLILTQACGAMERAILQEEEIRTIQNLMDVTAEFSGIIGKNPKMLVLYELIENIAPSDATVLIQGESGTGKELVAMAIHHQSPRKDKPFVVINCSAYPPTLIESELFGHEKGAFTGALRQKAGRFEQAHGGTVFLDEIGEIFPSAQIKLLRVLQNHKFERIGGEKTIEVDVRILAATNKDLLQEVKDGRFREDLFYRLNVIPIYLPPLRERPNDIPLLAHHFLRRFAATQGKEIETFSPEAMRILFDYPWPGNVRELENSIEHAAVLVKERQVQISDLPAVLQAFGNHGSNQKILPIMAEREREILEQVLKECNWNKRLAAGRLGISRNTLYLKLKKYQITKSSTLH